MKRRLLLVRTVTAAVSSSVFVATGWLMGDSGADDGGGRFAPVLSRTLHSDAVLREVSSLRTYVPRVRVFGRVPAQVVLPVRLRRCRLRLRLQGDGGVGTLRRPMLVSLPKLALEIHDAALVSPGYQTSCSQSAQGPSLARKVRLRIAQGMDDQANRGDLAPLARR